MYSTLLVLVCEVNSTVAKLAFVFRRGQENLIKTDFFNRTVSDI